MAGEVAEKTKRCLTYAPLSIYLVQKASAFSLAFIIKHLKNFDGALVNAP
jgi:hypothetical protein